MLHPLKQVRDHQHPLADPPALAPRIAPQLCRPQFAAKEVCRHLHPPNMVGLPSHSTTSGNHRKPVLESSGYETVQAVDGLQAVYRAFTSRPDLILMDLQLPEVSGLEVTRQLRGDDRS